ncbi:hypothetical protein HG530_011943 [Fusarium avenaceum]|nr:hypothetical protein HG530_011943 [Fusarium avenaceum]
MILLELDLLLLCFNLADLVVGDFLIVGSDFLLDGINLSPLCTKLLTSNFHNLVLQSLDLVLYAGRLFAELLDLPVVFGDLLLKSSNAAVADLLHLGVKLRNLLIQLLQASLTLPLVLLEFLELGLPAITVGLELGDLLLADIRDKLRRHEASLDGCTTTRHSTGLVNELTVKGDDSPSLSAVCDSVGLSEVGGDKSILHGVHLEFRLHLVSFTEKFSLFSLAILELLPFRRFAFLNGGDLGLKLLQGYSTSIGLLLENVEFTLSDCDCGLFLVDLLIPWLERLLLGSNLVREGLSLAFEAVSDLGELSFGSLDLFLKLCNLLGSGLNLLSTLFDGLVGFSRSRFGVGDGLLELLTLVVQKLALFVEFHALLLKLGHLFDQSLC